MRNSDNPYAAPQSDPAPPERPTWGMAFCSACLFCCMYHALAFSHYALMNERAAAYALSHTGAIIAGTLAIIVAGSYIAARADAD